MGDFFAKNTLHNLQYVGVTIFFYIKQLYTNANNLQDYLRFSRESLGRVRTGSVYRQSSSNFTVRSVRSKPKFFQVQNRKVAILIETSRNEWRNLKEAHFCLYIINIWYTAARSHDFSSALLYDAFSKILLLLLLSLSYRTRARAREWKSVKATKR